MPPPGRPAAAVDCGTNSTRLLVAAPDGTSLERRMRITRLGQAVDATHRLDPEAVARTLQVLAEYRHVMDERGVRRARLVATSAVRDAADGDDFLLAASTTVGVPAELLSGEEEGRLAYAGATADLPPAKGDDLVVDIGGGSTELIVGHAGDVAAQSLQIGCVRLTERHLRHDPPRPDEVHEAVAAIDRALASACRAQPRLARVSGEGRLIGLAGTVSTLAALDKGLGAYRREEIHHAVLTEPAVARWSGRLAAQPAAARLGHPGMEPGREDVIVAGALVLLEVMRRFGFDQCTVSESDILDGLVMSLQDEPDSDTVGRRAPS